MVELSKRDKEFVELFRWAKETFAARFKHKVNPKYWSGLVMQRLLSVEGVQQDLKTEEPKHVYYALRDFRKLNQADRERKATRLLKEWSV